LWIEASPLLHVKAGDPPFFIIHGDHDQHVSPLQAQEFAAAFQKAGVPVQLVIVKNGNHGLGSVPGQPPAVPNLATWHGLAVDFFDHYLKVDGK
jgi:dipeptidyl aminopeptidase/acylaminoacyl peptidase